MYGLGLLEVLILGLVVVVVIIVGVVLAMPRKR